MSTSGIIAEADLSSEHLAEDQKWMAVALGLARRAAQDSEVPVGAVVVRDGELVGEGSNAPISKCDPTAHAEIQALRGAAKNLGNYRLPGATLYVTIEPCTMCLGALVHARIDRLVFGAREPKSGAVVSQNQLLNNASLNTTIRYSEGVCEAQCSELMTSFFAERRQKKKALRARPEE